MIKYPNAKKVESNNLIENTTKNHNTSKLGMDLEGDINKSIEYYRIEDIAIIYKIPTPVKAVKIRYDGGHKTIIEGYFYTPSTTDYHGVYRSRYLDFEAKEVTSRLHFEFGKLHDHQREHMERVDKHGGISFVIIAFTQKKKTFLIDIKKLTPQYEQHLIDNKSYSLPYKFFETNGHEISGTYLCPIDFIKIVDKIYFNK